MDDTEYATNRRLLGDLINKRRRELRIRQWNEVARLARMSPENLRKIRKGEIGISEEAADGIEDALQWERGSVERAVRDGVPPAPRVVDAAPAEPVAVSAEAQEMFAAIKQMFRSWGLEMTPRMLDVWHDEVVRQLLLANRQQPSTTDCSQSGEDSDHAPD